MERETARKQRRRTVLEVEVHEGAVDKKRMESSATGGRAR